MHTITMDFGAEPVTLTTDGRPRRADDGAFIGIGFDAKWTRMWFALDDLSEPLRAEAMAEARRIAAADEARDLRAQHAILAQRLADAEARAAL